MTDVLIIGAGPTGLTAAAEAARHGLSVRIVDANKERSQHSKALVLHSRSLEIFTDMGFAAQVREAGQEFRALNIYANGKALTRIDFRAIDWQDAIYPFWLSLPQSETERHLEAHLNRLGVEVERQTKLTGLVQKEGQVEVTLEKIDDDGAMVAQQVVKVPWLIGCDGARSATRKLSDIAFEGTAEDERFILGDVQIEWDLAEDEGQNFMSSDGILLVVPLPKRNQFRIIAHMPALKAGQEPEITVASLQLLMDERSGLKSRVSDLEWHSNFSVKHLVAKRHRKGSVFLAGDAAHIHSPVGGQGLNTGIQDAYNLMWKLALVHQGKATQALLDSYQTERHEVAESTIKKVSFATKVVTLRNPLSKVLRNQLGAILINTDAVQNRMGRDVGMLDIRYQPSDVVAEDVSQGRKIIGKRDDGPQIGERAPNVLFLDEHGVAHSLIDSLYGTQHTLLLFAGQSDREPSQTLLQIEAMVRERYASTIRCYIVMAAPPSVAVTDGARIINSDAAVHRRFDAANEALYLIRPDHHIGYRSQPVTQAQFTDYLDKVMPG